MNDDDDNDIQLWNLNEKTLKEFVDFVKLPSTTEEDAMNVWLPPNMNYLKGLMCFKFGIRNIHEKNVVSEKHLIGIKTFEILKTFLTKDDFLHNIMKNNKYIEIQFTLSLVGRIKLPVKSESEIAMMIKCGAVVLNSTFETNLVKYVIEKYPNCPQETLKKLLEEDCKQIGRLEKCEDDINEKHVYGLDEKQFKEVFHVIKQSDYQTIKNSFLSSNFDHSTEVMVKVNEKQFQLVKRNEYALLTLLNPTIDLNYIFDVLYDWPHIKWPNGLHKFNDVIRFITDDPYIIYFYRWHGNDIFDGIRWYDFEEQIAIEHLFTKISASQLVQQIIKWTNPRCNYDTFLELIFVESVKKEIIELLKNDQPKTTQQ